MFRRLLGLVAALAIVAPVTTIAFSHPALAGTGPSQWCNDGIGDTEVTLLTSPVTLAVEINRNLSPSSPWLGVGICYATTPEGYSGPEATGGTVSINAFNTANGGPTATVACIPDSNPEGVAVNCGVGTTPTYTITPGPAGTTGDTITVNIPVSVCVEQCFGGSVPLNQTGLLVGQLQPTPPGGQLGASYQLTSLDLWVDGIFVTGLEGRQAGAAVSPFGQVADSLSPAGPCVVGVCAPLGGYIETTGAAPLVVLTLPIPKGTQVGVTVPKECLYANPSGSCP